MLFPRSHAWTPLQKWIITGTVFAGLVVLSTLVYTYERYYRGPDDTFFVGTWRGKCTDLQINGPVGFRFKANHTYEDLMPVGDSEFVGPTGRWYAGGDFLYLRVPRDDGSVPYSRLQA